MRDYMRKQEDEDRDLYTDEERDRSQRKKYLHPDGKLRYERPPSD